MKYFNSLIKDIKNNRIYPVYFLHGEESFFIDKLSKLIQNIVLEEYNKNFNQFILYANEIDYREVILLCREYPVGLSNKKVIILKEAQHYSDIIWKSFESYFNNIQPKTILVIEYKYKKFNNKNTTYNILNKKKWIYQFNKLNDYQLSNWILKQCLQRNLKIDQKAIVLLIEFLGNNLFKIDYVLQKMSLLHIKNIDSSLIRKNCFINRTYSIFDLTKALGDRNLSKVFYIINFFLQREKEFPIIKINYQIFYFYVQLMLVHTSIDKSKKFISELLKINEFFVNSLLISAFNYKLKEIIKIINIIYEYDLQFKGINNITSVSYKKLFQEMFYKILILKLK